MPVNARPQAMASPTAAGALALYNQVLSARSFKAAAHQMVAQVAQEGGFTRVSFGLHDRGRTRLLANSGLDPTQAPGASTLLITGAMDEALEQSVSLAWPAAEPQASAYIRLEQLALQQQVGGAVACIPLGFDGEAFAAVCVERHPGPPFGPDELARLEQLLLPAAGALRWMYYGDQPWHSRLRRAAGRNLAELRRPGRRGARRLLAAALLLLAFLAFAPLEYSVGGRARVEGAQQRVMSAPADGFIKAAHVRPGDRVRAGAALVDLVDEDLQLQHERWSSQLAQHENAYAAAMAKSDRVGASTSSAKVAEAQAQLALVDAQRVRGSITAPMDALVVQGDLSQSIGAPVRQGDMLLTLATTGSYRVVVDIDESDIAQVQVGQPGRLVVSSLPWEHQDIRVQRITPLAKAVEGRNVFEVEAQLAGTPPELRPGLLGRAELVVGRLPPLWAWGRQALDRIRLAWWSWLG